MAKGKYTFLDLATDVLKGADRPLTPMQIWDKAVADGFADKIKSKGQTPEYSVGSVLYTGVRNEDSIFAKKGKYPARFFLKENEGNMLSDVELEARDEKANQKKEQSPWDEKDLYPLLAYYVSSNESFNKGRSIYTKAIPHEKSKKAGYSQWVYPDMIGFYLPLADYSNEVVSLSNMLGDNLTRLYSFELKKRIDKSSYRESFFQAVSNSSWANEGYLVTAEIADDQDLLSELGRLSESFGIGIIALDIKNIDSSKIVFPATPKVSIGWETMNKISEENEVFRAFVQNVQDDFTIKKITPSNYEEVDQDSLENHMEKHFREK